MLEAINAPKQDIEGIRNSLTTLHNLAIVLPESYSDSPVYRYNSSMDTLRFPPTLASVIYAAFHKDDDADYFDIVAEATSGNVGRSYVDKVGKDVEKDAGLRYDPASRRIVPVGHVSTPVERMELASSSTKAPAYGGTGGAGADKYREYRKVVAGILNNPESLKRIGEEFGTHLYDLMDHMESRRSETPLLDDLSHILEKYGKEYRAELVSDQGIKTGELVKGTDRPEIKYLSPKADVKIGMDEIYVYMACRMSEDYGAGIEESAKEIAGGKRTDMVSVDDTVAYIKGWIEGNGLPDTREYQTGEGSTEYLAIDIENPDIDLSGAPVAPEYLVPLFAKDCSVFMKRRGGDRITDGKLVKFGIETIADALGIEHTPYDQYIKDGDRDFGDYFDYLCELNNGRIMSVVGDAAGAMKLHDSSVAFLDRKAVSCSGNERKVIDEIRRQVFQVMGDGQVPSYPGVSGSGDETLLRRTGVATGNITARIRRALGRFPDEFKVEDDDRDSGKMTVKLGNDMATVDRNDEKSVHGYTRPTLFPYLDSTSSFVTYAVWKGIVPYSRMVDNQLDYLNDEDEELYAARAEEGPELAGSVLSSGIGRNPAVSLTGKKDFQGTGDLDDLDKSDLLETLPPEVKNQAMGNREIAKMLDPPSLLGYSVMANIVAYDGAFNNIMHHEVDSAVAPVKYAFRDVFGNIPAMVSGMSQDALMGQVREKAIRYMEAQQGSELEIGIKGKGQKEQFAEGRAIIKEYGKELADELFSNLNMDIPAEFAKAYGADERGMLTAFRTLLMDLAVAAMAISEGYGYHGLTVTNTYSGGKYTSGNRIMVQYDAKDENEPIFDFGGAGEMRGFDEIENDRETSIAIVKQALELLDDSTLVTSDPDRMRVVFALAKKLDRYVNVPTDVKEVFSRSAVDALVHEDSEHKFLEYTYSVLYTILASLIVGGPVTRDVNAGMFRSIGGNAALDKIDEEIYNILYDTGKSGKPARASIAKLERIRETLAQLTDGGKLIEGLTDAFRGTAVGDEKEHTAYAELAAAAVGAMKSIRDTDDLKDSVTKFFKTDPRKLSSMGEDSTVSLEDLDEPLEAPEHKLSAYDLVDAALKEWKPDSTGVYNGLTGMLGFDTIRAGKGSTMSSAITPLTSGDSAFAGLDRGAVDKCAAYIQSARDDLEEFSEKHGEGIANISAMSAKRLWADELIEYIGRKYMESRDRIALSKGPDGIAVTPDSAEQWRKLVSEVLSGIKTRCARRMPGTAPIRYEIGKFLDDGLQVGDGRTLESVSEVSTALAHIILRLGDLTRETAVPNPFAGREAPASRIPGELRDIAQQRSLGNSELTKDAARMKTGAAASRLETDDTLARELESIYNDLRMNATEGSDRYLDFFRAAIHNAYNKLHGTDREISVSIAPNDDIAKMYGHVMDDEAGGDRSYGSVAEAVNEKCESGEIDTVDDLLSSSGLYDKIENGPMRGTTYADAAFGHDMVDASADVDAARLINTRRGMDCYVKALRMQIADRLLGNRSFDWLKRNRPDAMEQMSGLFFSLAQNLDSGHTDTIFAALDPAERNAGHYARIKKLKSEMDDEATLGSLYDEDEAMKKLSGKYPDRKVGDVKKLESALSDIVDPETGDPEKAKAKREAAYSLLKEVAGEKAVNYVENYLASQKGINILTSDDSDKKNKLVDALKNKVIGIVAVNPRKVYDTAMQVQSAEARTYAMLAGALHDIYVNGSKDSVENGIRFVKGLFGDSAMGFINNAMDVLKERNVKPDESMDTIESLLDDLRSSKSPYPELIERHARKMSGLKGPAARKEAKDKELLGEPMDTAMVGSTNAQSRRMREVGGDYGTSFVAPGKAENLEAIKESVRKLLASFDVKSSKNRRNMFSNYLSGIGFTGSVDDFCKEVLGSDGIVDPEKKMEIAEEYADDRKNYNMTAINKWLSTAMGSTAREAARTPRGGHVDEDTIRIIAHSDIPNISMVTDGDGNETDSIRIGDSGPLSIDSPDARSRMTLVINRAEEITGKSLFSSDGKVDRDVASAMGKIAAGGTAPIDPKLATESMVNLLSGIMTSTSWAAVDPEGRFVRRFKEKGKDGKEYGFEATFGKDHIIKYVRSLVGSRFGGDTHDAIRREMMQYLSLKKGERKGSIPLLEETVKNAIDKVVHRMAKGMIAGGDSIATSDGITVRVIKSPK